MISSKLLVQASSVTFSLETIFFDSCKESNFVQNCRTLARSVWLVFAKLNFTCTEISFEAKSFRFLNTLSRLPDFNEKFFIGCLFLRDGKCFRKEYRSSYFSRRGKCFWFLFFKPPST